MIDRVRHFYETDNSNVHRAAHTLVARATEVYEGAVQPSPGSSGWEMPRRSSSRDRPPRRSTWSLRAPAPALSARATRSCSASWSTTPTSSRGSFWPNLPGARIKVLPIDDGGDVRLGALVVVDGAQAVAHLPVDVAALDVDFFAFSSHKVFGPTGIGALYGKRRLLEEMPPWQGGGSMIDTVTFERSTYAPVPAKFEAGTGHIAGAAGLAAALDYVDALGRPAIMEHELALVLYMVRCLGELPRVDIIGNPRVRGSAVSFVVDGMEPEDVARHLDQDGIAVRAGHHCAQPVLRHFGLTSTVRPSIALYNTSNDVDELVASLRRLVTSPPSWNRLRREQLPPRTSTRGGVDYLSGP